MSNNWLLIPVNLMSTEIVANYMSRPTILRVCTWMYIHLNTTASSNVNFTFMVYL